MAATKTIRAQRESQLQTACVRWFRIQYPMYGKLLFTVPNGTRLAGTTMQRARAWKRLELEGAVSGASDLVLAIATPDCPGLFIEMKMPKGNQTMKQEAFQRSVEENSNGYKYILARSFDDFQTAIENHLAALKPVR